MRVAQKAAEGLMGKGGRGGGGAVSFHLRVHGRAFLEFQGEKPLKMVWLFNIPKT